MKDFVFIKNDFLVPLPDSISLCERDELEKWSENSKQGEKFALISNEKSPNAQIYAPEINFYLKNSQDECLDKAKNTLLLYEVRASLYDLGLDLEYDKQVGANVIIASAQDKGALCEFLGQNGFKALQVSEVLGVYGAVGELGVITQEKGAELEIECDFFFYDEFKTSFDKQSGCYDLRKFSDERALLEFLQVKSPIYRYKNYINYDSSICQYDKRREECCGKCAELCPSVAILKDDEKRQLVFSQVDCVGCGDCVSVCPSGSLEFTPLPSASFWALLDFYKGKKILLVDEKFSLENLEISLDKNVLPLVLNSAQLNETTLLALLQTSGANITLCATRLSKGNEDAIALLNAIFERKFNKKAILVAFDKESLEKALKECEFIDDLRFDLPQHPMLKREHFAKRLLHIVENDDLGVVESGEWLRYGQVRVNETNCTLCLACVGACNVGALVADSKDNSLKFNASLCTTCGYCVASCAEKDTIELERSGIELKASYFHFHTLAHDELFACVECGKEFATKKAVERVANLMKDKFAGNERKLKTLYCCAECKARLMIFS